MSRFRAPRWSILSPWGGRGVCSSVRVFVGHVLAAKGVGEGSMRWIRERPAPVTASWAVSMGKMEDRSAASLFLVRNS